MIDGNKRLGAHAMLIFLALNGCELSFTMKELEDIILEIASKDTGSDEILNWIIEHQI